MGACSSHLSGVSPMHDCQNVLELVTEDDLHRAAASVAAWHEAQSNPRPGPQAVGKGASLLDRVGGSDTVKSVVEKFYTALFGDPELAPFFEGYDMVYMRAKQSAFMQWLFGPGIEPYRGRDVRRVHLRLIRQKGFGPEHFDKACNYFADILRGVGATEPTITEVLHKILPTRTAIFTPSPKDAEEEARWAAHEQQPHTPPDAVHAVQSGVAGLAAGLAAPAPATCPFSTAGGQDQQAATIAPTTAAGGAARAPSPLAATGGCPFSSLQRQPREPPPPATATAAAAVGSAAGDTGSDAATASSGQVVVPQSGNVLGLSAVAGLKAADSSAQHANDDEDNVTNSASAALSATVQQESLEELQRETDELAKQLLEETEGLECGAAVEALPVAQPSGAELAATDTDIISTAAAATDIDTISAATPGTVPAAAADDGGSRDDDSVLRMEGAYVRQPSRTRSKRRSSAHEGFNANAEPRCCVAADGADAAACGAAFDGLAAGDARLQSQRSKPDAIMS